jgi:hypothetical protein
LRFGETVPGTNAPDERDAKQYGNDGVLKFDFVSSRFVRWNLS